MMTPNVKESIEMLISYRAEVRVNADNPYIFACPTGNSVLPLRGYDCMHKYAMLCAARHPETLTATKLRKHLATLSQILSLTNGELEQLANHLGHDVNVHKQYYRLPQEILFLAKVSKVLIAAENGQLAKYKGKSMEEMNVMDTISESELSEGEDDNDKGTTTQRNDHPASQDKACTSGTQNTKKKATRISWTKEEEEAILQDDQISICIRSGHPPNTKMCQHVKVMNQCLSERSIVQIKSKAWNLIQKQQQKKSASGWTADEA